ncbi:cupin domain-containing protein [Pseudenhygromyxa sp. WMMC2535]|uniref:1,2-dihydroxy-3-keto-5-methylthiopentene dioxygenase n=1 Tax=Pseudenhygromyxa sp. WMMC2535 TaxID=2712867 RepID=UPI0015543CFD|nr:cupin domain-containing protein [Pseudenhygromyxa sp. WMMC2535]NVB39726.1 cupin domain-containing protein [Pseudenhygromyxa sp. WMMC2535]
MELAWLEPKPDYPSLSVDHLRGCGVTYERLELAGERYQGPLDALKAAEGYIEQDIVELRPDTGGLDEICAKFADEHLHTEDEVRFVLEGEGVFEIRDDDDRWMRVTVQPGDLIVVPKDRYHRFFLTERKQIRCVRLFQDRAGWVPQYRA